MTSSDANSSVTGKCILGTSTNRQGNDSESETSMCLCVVFLIWRRARGEKMRRVYSN